MRAAPKKTGLRSCWEKGHVPCLCAESWPYPRSDETKFKSNMNLYYTFCLPADSSKWKSGILNSSCLTAWSTSWVMKILQMRVSEWPLKSCSWKLWPLQETFLKVPSRVKLNRALWLMCMLSVTDKRRWHTECSVHDPQEESLAFPLCIGGLLTKAHGSYVSRKAHVLILPGRLLSSSMTGQLVARVDLSKRIML